MTVIIFFYKVYLCRSCSKQRTTCSRRFCGLRHDKSDLANLDGFESWEKDGFDPVQDHEDVQVTLSQTT